MRSLCLILLFTFLVSCGPKAESDLESKASSLSAESSPVNDPGLPGPFQVSSFQPMASSDGYKSAIIYYPTDSGTALLAATTLSGGFTNKKEDMAWLAAHLASHGIVTIVFTPTRPNSVDARIWAKGHEASLDTLEAENASFGGPLNGRLDGRRLGVMGFSLGGAGAILAADELGNRIRSAVPICAFTPATPRNQIPFMFVTGTDDIVAEPLKIYWAFDKFATAMPKSFVKLNNLNHGSVASGTQYHESIARFVSAWSLVFLADLPSYKTYLNGEEAKKQVANKSVFARARDYIYRE